MTEAEAERAAAPEMVEQVAKALHEAFSKQDVMAYLDGEFDCHRLARAAIEAMRSTTEAMRAAATEIAIDTGRGHETALNCTETVTVWNAMIDAALSPKGDA